MCRASCKRLAMTALLPLVPGAETKVVGTGLLMVSGKLQAVQQNNAWWQMMWQTTSGGLWYFIETKQSTGHEHVC